MIVCGKLLAKLCQNRLTVKIPCTQRFLTQHLLKATPGVFSKCLKLTLAHNYWDNDSMRKAKRHQDSLFINLFLSLGINEISLKGLKIQGSLPMEFQLYALKGHLYGSCLKVGHWELYFLGMKRGQQAMIFSRCQNIGIYCTIYRIFSFSQRQWKVKIKISEI